MHQSQHDAPHSGLQPRRGSEWGQRVALEQDGTPAGGGTNTSVAIISCMLLCHHKGPDALQGGWGGCKIDSQLRPASCTQHSIHIEASGV